jgi:cytosine/creatinine deaminase
MSYDLVIRNAQLRGGERVDIAVADARYARIAPHIDGPGNHELDAAGCIVTESPVIAQLHLDKVFTGPWIDELAKTEYFTGGSMGGAMTGIELAARVKERYEESEMLERVTRALEEAVFTGATHIRAFVDVDSKAKLKGIQACLHAREDFRDRIELQVVAFPQDGLIREPGTEELLHEAMELGADLVGGIPWIEYSEADMRRHIDIAFEIARRYDADVAMLVDDAGDPGLRTTELLALKTIAEGWQARVSACHARAMALYNEVYHRKLTALLKKAGMGIVSNPHTGPLHVRIKDLLAEGVPIALGGESVNDSYYPYGRNNMLEVAFIASHMLWAMTADDQEALYDMITTHPARIMRLSDHRIAEGCAANLVVLAHATMRDVFTYHVEPRYVVRRGRVIAESESVRTAHAKAPTAPA